MKANLAIKKGLFLALTLIFLNKLLCMFGAAEHMDEPEFQWMSAVAFGIIVLLFLLSKKISALFITGLIGLATLGVCEIILTVSGTNSMFLPGMGNLINVFYIYLLGFLGSFVATIVAIVIVLCKANFDMFDMELGQITIGSDLKAKLLIYTLLSAIGVSYLLLPTEAAVSVLVFAVLQFVLLWFVMPNKKKLWLYIPIFVLALNSFISGNAIWRVPNAIVSVFLYSVMFTDVSIKGRTSSGFLLSIIKKAMAPFSCMQVPFKWSTDVCGGKKPLMKRVIVALIIAIPLIIVLILMLSYADMVFAQSAREFFRDIFDIFTFNAIWKLICGVIAGLFLFGLVYTSYARKAEETVATPRARHGDPVIVNIVLSAVLIVYTFFVVIQFRYLFAGATLPYGLTYTEYARKGFFELFLLTGINIMAILLTVYFTKDNVGMWNNLTKWLCTYLCAVTVVLLISSFYRMYLYSADDGLTRLRFLVFGFLIFEGVGLAFTFVYIFKPQFNMVCIYLAIGLVYYILLNVVPMDYFVAKSQVDLYLDGGREGVEYVTTLSTDAALQVERLIGSGADAQARMYFDNHYEFYSNMPERWQRYNLSVDACNRICEKTLK